MQTTDLLHLWLHFVPLCIDIIDYIIDIIFQIHVSTPGGVGSVTVPQTRSWTQPRPRTSELRPHPASGPRPSVSSLARTRRGQLDTAAQPQNTVEVTILLSFLPQSKHLRDPGEREASVAEAHTTHQSS